MDLGEGWYLITAATYEHQPFFETPAELRALESRLLEALTDAELLCAGWVVLPNHYHALIRTDDVARVGKAIGPVHGRSSRYVNLRAAALGRQVWYKFNDRKMRSERHFWATTHYIAYNPVKHGYADAVEDWPWSCIHELVAERGAVWFRELVNDYPLADYGDKWDV